MVQSLNLRLIALRVIGALLMLAAATHAVLPVGAHTGPQTGSAFSADTVDVAIACDRHQIETRAVPERPAPPISSCGSVSWLHSAKPPQSNIPDSNRARAPPLPGPALSPINPRAPPAA